MKKIKKALKHKNDVIFDLDETITTLLVDWSEYRFGMKKALLKQFPDIQNLLEGEDSAIDLANIVINAKGKAAKDLINKFSQEYESQFYRGNQINELLVSFIKQYNKNYNFYVWTNNQRPLAELVLKDLGIFDYFDLIVSATDTIFYKPNVEGFNLIREVKNQDLSDFLMIGDSRHDEQAAINAHIEFINVRDLV